CTGGSSVVGSSIGRGAVAIRGGGVMQPSASQRSLRRLLLGVAAVVLSVVCGIGMAAAASVDRPGRAAAGKARAPVGVVRQRGEAPAGAVRVRGQLQGLVAPLGAQQGGARSKARPLAPQRVEVVGRSAKAQVMASALLDPKVTVGTQPTGVAVSA